MIGEAPLELRHLRYFATVVRERNFTRAVEKLQCGFGRLDAAAVRSSW
jgi:hypothetical protein